MRIEAPWLKGTTNEVASGPIDFALRNPRPTHFALQEGTGPISKAYKI
jgi:hypothetical protein